MCVKGMIFTFCFEMFKLCSESDTSCSQLSSALSVISGNWRVELIRKIKITQAEVDVLIMLMLQPAPKNKYVRASCKRSTTARLSNGGNILLVRAPTGTQVQVLLLISLPRDDMRDDMGSYHTHRMIRAGEGWGMMPFIIPQEWYGPISSLDFIFSALIPQALNVKEWYHAEKN